MLCFQDLNLRCQKASLVQFQDSQVDGTETEIVIRLDSKHMAVLTLSTTTGTIKVTKDLPGVSLLLFTDTLQYNQGSQPTWKTMKTWNFA